MKLKILVCIKIITDPESNFTIDEEKQSICVDENAVLRISRYDEFALEEALLIQEKFPETEVTAISVGPERKKQTLRRSIEMGVNNAVFIQKELNDINQSRSAAVEIAKYVSDNNYNLIFTGVMSEDSMLGQTGPMIAALINSSCATSVIKQEPDLFNKTMNVHREIDSSTNEQVILRLPAVITIQSGINSPRYPSLSNKLRAKKQKIITVNSSTTNDTNEYEKVIKIKKAETDKETIFLQGSLEEKASELKKILYKRSLL